MYSHDKGSSTPSRTTIYQMPMESIVQSAIEKFIGPSTRTDHASAGMDPQSVEDMRCPKEVNIVDNESVQPLQTERQVPRTASGGELERAEPTRPAPCTCIVQAHQDAVMCEESPAVSSTSVAAPPTFDSILSKLGNTEQDVLRRHLKDAVSHETHKLQVAFDSQLRQENNRKEETKHQFRCLEKRYKEVCKLLDIRGQELQSAQAFLTRADECSLAELVQITQALNDEIYQTASFVAESVLNGSSHAALYQVFVAQGEATEHGFPLITKLRRGTERCMLVEQFIFQHFLGSAAVKELTRWGGSRSKATFINQIVEAMSKVEPPAVCGKWRALAHMYDPAMANKQEDQSRVLRVYERAIFTAVKEIGYPHNPLDQSSRETLISLQDRLEGVVKKAILLRNSISRSVTNRTISIGFFAPNHAFYNHKMTNAYDEIPAVEKEDKIVATVGVGLCATSPSRPEDEQWLLKPKIVLEKLLLEL